MIRYAKIQAADLLEVCMESRIPALKKDAFVIVPAMEVRQLSRRGDRYFLKTGPFNLMESYILHVQGVGEKFIQPDGILDALNSSKTLGHTRKDRSHSFRLFAPRATQVSLVLFKTPQEHCDTRIQMTRDEDGVWETTITDPHEYLYYGYCVDGPEDITELFDASEVLADPYSKAVLTLNHFRHPSKTLLNPPLEFDWEGDTWKTIPMEDLVIYELHVRDMTIHSSSGVPENLRGTYLGLCSEGSGGLNHLLRLGVNCIELMPVQEFGNIEVDYKNTNLEIYNEWNAYERNHWGYMTSYFFAPENYYSTGATMKAHHHIGMDGRAVTELKTLVKELHSSGMAVVMDVVYNHVSQYDLNPLKYTDKKYYFRLNDDQEFLTESGCGNDFKTERPMARRLIIESLLYWMIEYHIDGFRFDIAPLIDYETQVCITRELRAVNPNVILIAEPWGAGRYDLHGFSKLGWSAWNDLFRNQIKGQNPNNGLGLIFGSFWNGVDQTQIRNRLSGSTVQGGGPFLKAGHAVNYLESHDDHTLGDFIRIGLGEIDPGRNVTDRDTHAKLTPGQMKIHKLSALLLMTSRGAVMMHAGQEFGRSKLIAPSDKPDTRPGFIDHNSYNKDDETNWINYSHLKTNEELVAYYAGLIRVRTRFLSSRKLKKGSPVFLETSDPLVWVFRYTLKDSGTILVAANCNRLKPFSFILPAENWKVLADEVRASDQSQGALDSKILEIGPSSGFILMAS